MRDKKSRRDRLYSKTEALQDTEKEGDAVDVFTKDAGRELTLTLRGELDHHGARDVMQRMELALDAALPLRLVLDFSGVCFMDSSGIAVVMRAQKRMRALGGSAVLRQVPPQAKRVFDTAGIFRIVPLEEGEKSDEGQSK